MRFFGASRDHDARLEGGASAGDGAIDVGRVARRDRGDDLAADRADAVERLARDGIDVLAVDECLRADREVGDDVGDAGRVLGGRGHRCLRAVGVGAPASRGSRTRMVRAPSPRRSRSERLPDAVERVDVRHDAREVELAGEREVRQLGEVRAGSPEP